MSESYKINEDGLYYVTFAVVGWLDVFTRGIYQDIFTEKPSEALTIKKHEAQLRVYGGLLAAILRLSC